MDLICIYLLANDAEHVFMIYVLPIYPLGQNVSLCLLPIF